MGIHFDLKRSVDQYMFNLKAANGETVLTSERYKTKQGSEGGIASVKTNAPLEARYRRHDGRADVFGLHRTVRSLQRAHRSVRVQRHDQAVTGFCRLPEQRDMARMQDVEASVGEAHAMAVTRPPFA